MDVLLIGAIIIGITQAIKFLAPKVRGIITIVVAILVGIVVALVSSNTKTGLDPISVANGILIALGAVGVHVTATNSSTPKA